MTCRGFDREHPCTNDAGALTLCDLHLRRVLAGGTVTRHGRPLSVAPNRLPSAAPRGAEQAVTAPAGSPG